MYVCMYVGMYVCTSVYIYTYVCLCVYIYIERERKYWKGFEIRQQNPWDKTNHTTALSSFEPPVVWKWNPCPAGSPGFPTMVNLMLFVFDLLSALLSIQEVSWNLPATPSLGFDVCLKTISPNFSVQCGFPYVWQRLLETRHLAIARTWVPLWAAKGSSFLVLMYISILCLLVCMTLRRSHVSPSNNSNCTHWFQLPAFHSTVSGLSLRSVRTCQNTHALQGPTLLWHDKNFINIGSCSHSSWNEMPSSCHQTLASGFVQKSKNI